MPKHIYCAQCGMELLMTRKAVRKINKIIEVVEPHNCKEDIEELKANEPQQEVIPIPKDTPPNLDAMFDSFKFVKNINGLREQDPRHTGMPEGHEDDYSDRRPESQKKQTSTVPGGILDHIKTLQPGMKVPEKPEE